MFSNNTSLHVCYHPILKSFPCNTVRNNFFWSVSISFLFWLNFAGVVSSLRLTKLVYARKLNKESLTDLFQVLLRSETICSNPCLNLQFLRNLQNIFCFSFSLETSQFQRSLPASSRKKISNSASSVPNSAMKCLPSCATIKGRIGAIPIPSCTAT